MIIFGKKMVPTLCCFIPCAFKYLSTTKQLAIYKTLNNHTDSVTVLVDLKNGYLASGSKDNTIIVWNLNTTQMQTRLRNHTNAILSLVLLKSSYLASSSQDRSIKIWNWGNTSSPLIQTLLGHNGKCVCTLVFFKSISIKNVFIMHRKSPVAY